jgi:hypothetical protein
MKVVALIPEISEFSYGFALTNEIVGWSGLTSAPIFPSLIEEGKKGGGYDVKLDQPGAPLYLQFKRADYMTRKSAGEIKHHGLPLTLPFYRFPITQRNKSFQHTSLVELDDGTNLVFYAAPRFHMLSEINDAWQAKDVAARSIFVAPTAIGLIHDNEKHHVSYDSSRSYFCSEPEEIEPISANALRSRILEHLSKDSRPLREQMPDWLQNIREKRTRARQTQTKIEAERAERAIIDRDRLPISSPVPRAMIEAEESEPLPAAEPSPEIRDGRALKHEEHLLRTISDEALHGFGAQLFVVQSTLPK